MPLRWLGVLLLSTFLPSAPGPVRAQTPAASNPLDAAFAEMMARPDDPDAAVRYARLAASRGEARAAITALERVLRGDPSLDNIRLELASLHLASGAPELAAAYTRQALESPQIPPDVAQRARLLLAQAERGASRSTLAVNLFAGARYDSNANEATGLGTVPVFIPVLQDVARVPTPIRGRSDWSAVLGGSAIHRQDLGLQREGTWETSAAVFEQRFARIPRVYDLSIVSLETGPRVGVAEFGASTLALRPFASLSWIGYGGETFAWLYGGGLTAELRMPSRWTAQLTALGRFGNYENSGFRPRAREYTGSEWSVGGSLAYQIKGAITVAGSLAYYDAGARQEYFARRGLIAGLAAQSRVPVGRAYEVGVAARAGVRPVRYGAPDPFIDPSRRRRDTRWVAGMSLIFPLATSVALTLDYDWYDQRSNYDFYRYDNHAVTLGVRVSL